MNRSSAATTAAASSGEASGATIVSCGTPIHPGAGGIVSPNVPALPVLDHDTVLAAVAPGAAIERVRDAFVAYHAGEWTMPAKVYLESPPFGDFRAMPARGGGIALLKWITSFPGNPAHGLPTVTGVVCVSDATNGEPLMLLDARSVTALRTGAVAAVATRALAAPDARSVGLVGCGLHGAWVARCLAVAGYGPGVCFDRDASAATAVATELGWETGAREDAVRCEVVCCVTPGSEIVIDAGDLRPGQHLNMLGADGPGKAEASIGAVGSCALFCDEWAQASHGGELTGAIEAGIVTRDRVTELGRCSPARRPGGRGPRRSRCSIRRASRSRISRSPPRRSRLGERAQYPRRPCRSSSSYRGMFPCLRFGTGSRLVCERLERGDDLRPGLVRDDHVVDVATLGGHVGVGEVGLVVVDQLLPAGVGRRR